MGTGLFIALEGIDGTGTTTQASRLVRRLRRRKIPASLTQEPSGGPIGRLIDRLISAKSPRRSADSFHETVALLFAADRLDHLDAEIVPALSKGRVVVSDRYVMSSWAYQSVVLKEQYVREINWSAPMADLTILLDAPVDLCLERVSSRKAARQVFEKEKFLREVRSIYLRLARREAKAGERVVIVDAGLPIDEVEAAIWRHVESLLVDWKVIRS